MTAPLKKHKKILLIAGTIIIFLFIIGIMTYDTAVDNMTMTHSAMSSTLNTFESKYERAENLTALINQLSIEARDNSKAAAKLVFTETNDIQTALDILKNDHKDYYLIDASGNLYASKNAAPLDLSESQLKELKSNGFLEIKTENRYSLYIGYDIPEGFLISIDHNDKEFEADSALTGIALEFDCFIAPSSDKIITLSSDETLTGQRVPEELEESEIRIDRSVKNKNDEYSYGFTELNGKYSYCLMHDNGNFVFGLYKGYTKIVSEVINEMITPFAVLAGAFTLILVFFFILWKDNDNSKKKWVRVFKTKSYFDHSVITHIAGYVLFTLLITVIFNAFFLSCSAFSIQGALSGRSLDLLAENISASENDMNNIVGRVKNFTANAAEDVADLFVLDGTLCTHEKLKQVNNDKPTTEISVYDKNGILEASSGDYTGYELTKNEDNPMHAAWAILTDGVDSVFKDYDDGTGRFLLAQKRKDAPGIICIVYRNPILTQALKYFSKEDAIRNTDFGNATTFMVKLEDDSKTFIIEPYSSELIATDLTLPEELMQNKYSGLTVINDKECYVTTRRSEGITIISSVSSELLNIKRLADLVSLLAGFILLALLLFCCSLCHPTIEENAEEAEQPEQTTTTDRNKKTLFADDTFRRMVKYFFAVIVIGYCLMLFKNNAEGQTMIDFIFGGKWEKSFNLFSINASIVVAAVTLILVYLINKLLAFIGKCIGPKGITVFKIIISILKFTSLFVIIGYTLSQFGVNTTALLASAGIVGLAIGIAAKDIFGDLIAGLFLIFEGNIKVGDFIKFKDFRGEVAEMSVRVTVLKRYNSKLIVNNSDLKQFYRLSDELGSAWVETDIGPNEDVDKVKKLIESSSEWYQSMIPALKAGPFFSNISHFDSSSITICMTGICMDEKSGSTKRKLLYYTAQLFRENGISLGKNLMKIELESEPPKSDTESDPSAEPGNTSPD